MTHRFIMGLWTPPASDPRYADRYRAKTLAEVAAGVALADQLDANIYAVGAECWDTILAAGGSPRGGVCLPVQPPTMRHWGTKLTIVRHALETYDAVTWVDLDATLLAPIPANYVKLLSKRSPIQMVIRSWYRRRQCPWRGAGARDKCAAAVWYCRSKPLIDAALAFMRAGLPDEEQALSMVVDGLLGGYTLERYQRAKMYYPFHHHHGCALPANPKLFTAK